VKSRAKPNLDVVAYPLPGHPEISANFVNTAHVGKALRACTAGRPRSSFFVTAHWLRSKESEAAFALKKDLKDVCTTNDDSKYSAFQWIYRYSLVWIM
jgi:hypothetical protein